MWRLSKIEWQLSIGGWLVSMMVMLVWGVVPAALIATPARARSL
jgi:hypothetical protein